MPRQIREILASIRETADRGQNTGAPGKHTGDLATLDTNDPVIRELGV